MSRTKIKNSTKELIRTKIRAELFRTFVNALVISCRHKLPSPRLSFASRHKATLHDSCTTLRNILAEHDVQILRA